MNYRTVLSIMQSFEQGAAKIDFVSPIVSAVCGALASQGRLPGPVVFTPGAKSYADNNGLSNIIQGRYDPPEHTGLQGQTYTKLTRLQTSNDVDNCNKVISDLIFGRLGDHGRDVAGRLAHVVGELHDNVASHAGGVGFSCAQVYDYTTGPTVEFAIADNGCGMLRNVRNADATIMDDADAIRWCLKEGNTSAPRHSSWAQRLPEDALYNPYPDSVETRSEENNHLGKGLSHLDKLICETGGELWIWSGDGQYVWQPTSKGTIRRSETSWQGVAIEFSVPVTRKVIDATPSADVDKYRDLGRRFGI
ncbi:MAG: hypothetical protein V3R99_03990 [Thermoguttaceae bacterium]